MPLTMDVFKGDAFSAISLTQALDKLSYRPQFLGSLGGLWVPAPVTTTDIYIESRSSAPALIKFTERGSPPVQKSRDVSDARNFRTLRIAQSTRLNAASLQNIRAFGSETELKTLQTEMARMQFRMNEDIELTFEFHRLNAVTQAKVLDADGTTVMYDWSTEFNQSIPAEVDFDLDNPTPARGALRLKCNTARRAMMRALKGLGGNGVVIMALCGDDFWDNLITHPEVRETYLQTQQASDLRGNAFGPWEAFVFGSITFVNYRGTDDNTTVAVAAAKAKFFPINAGIFQMAYSPGEGFDFANTLGRERYSLMITDRDRNAWADLEQYSYPLPVCTMPSALYQARYT